MTVTLNELDDEGWESERDARSHTTVSSGGRVFDDFRAEIRRLDSTQVLMVVNFIWENIVVSCVNREKWRVTH